MFLPFTLFFFILVLFPCLLFFFFRIGLCSIGNGTRSAVLYICLYGWMYVTHERPRAEVHGKNLHFSCPRLAYVRTAYGPHSSAPWFVCLSACLSVSLFSCLSASPCHRRYHNHVPSVPRARDILYIVYKIKRIKKRGRVIMKNPIQSSEAAHAIS